MHQSVDESVGQRLSGSDIFIIRVKDKGAADKNEVDKKGKEKHNEEEKK